MLICLQPDDSVNVTEALMATERITADEHITSASVHSESITQPSKPHVDAGSKNMTAEEAATAHEDGFAVHEISHTTSKTSSINEATAKPTAHQQASNTHHTTNDHGDASHPQSQQHVETTKQEERILEPYSWWKIVVTLVVFCAIAGIILWILRVTESSSCRNKSGDKSEEEDIMEEDKFGSSSNEKLSTSRV